MNNHNKKKLVFFYACILILSYSILILFSKEIVIYLTQEDGLYEWIGTLSLFASSILFLLLAIKGKKSISAIYYLLFFLVFTFGFMEEINWGQRIFNLEAPEILKEMNNHQITMHNIPLIERNENGERRLLSFERIISIFWLTYLLILPLMNKYSVKIHNLIMKFKFPVSPIWIGIFFVINYSINSICLYYFTNYHIQYIVEIKEFNLELLLLIMSFSIYEANKNTQNYNN